MPSKSSVCAAIVLIGGSQSFDAAGQNYGIYRCRYTEVRLVKKGDLIEPARHEFEFMPIEQTTTALSGPVPALGTDKEGNTVVLVISKLDGTFEGIRVHRLIGETTNSGVCKRI